MRKIMISIALVAMMLTGCSQKEARTTAVEDVATNTIATVGDADTATTEEVVEEPAPEKETLEDNNEVTTEVPATTEIGGGKKKAEETTEEQKPTTNGGASNSGSQKPSNSSNGGSGHSSTSGSSSSSSANNGSSNSSGNNSSGSSSSSSGNNSSNNGGSNNSGGSIPSTTEAPKPSTTEAPTTQHQHVYDQVVVDTPAWTETIVHPAEYKTVPAMQCHGCKGIFTSADAYFSHPCSDAYGFTSTNAKEKVKEETTEYVEHPAVTHKECKCGARE